MLEETSALTEMPVGILGAPGEAGQCLRGFECMPARNLWHLPTLRYWELIGVSSGCLHVRTSSSLWAGVGWRWKADPAVCILAFPSPVQRQIPRGRHCSALVWVMPDAVWSSRPGRCDRGEHSRVLGEIAGKFTDYTYGQWLVPPVSSSPHKTSGSQTAEKWTFYKGLKW